MEGSKVESAENKLVLGQFYRLRVKKRKMNMSATAYWGFSKMRNIYLGIFGSSLMGVFMVNRTLKMHFTTHHNDVFKFAGDTFVSLFWNLFLSSQTLEHA